MTTKRKMMNDFERLIPNPLQHNNLVNLKALSLETLGAWILGLFLGPGLDGDGTPRA